MYTLAAEARKCHKILSNVSAVTSFKAKWSYRVKNFICKLAFPRAREQAPPKTSPSNYVIESYYAPEGYYLFKDKYKKPWSIMLRILLVTCRTS